MFKYIILVGLMVIYIYIVFECSLPILGKDCIYSSELELCIYSDG